MHLFYFLQGWGLRPYFSAQVWVVTCSPQTCMLRRRLLAFFWRAKVKWGPCSAYTFEVACISYYGNSLVRRKQRGKKIFRLWIWIQFFKRPLLSPAFKYVATLQNLSLYLFLRLRPALGILSEALGIYWHGSLLQCKVILKYPILFAWIVLCSFIFWIHIQSEMKIPCPDQYLAAGHLI